MTLRDTIHEVFPDLARLDCAPDYRVDASEHDQQLLFQAWIREADDGIATSVVEAFDHEWDRWQAGVRLFLASANPVGLHEVRLKLMDHKWVEIEDAIQGEWEIARDQRKFG